MFSNIIFCGKKTVLLCFIACHLSYRVQGGAEEHTSEFRCFYPAMDCDYSNDDGLEAFPPRGWSMRRGHRKALEARSDRKSLGFTPELSLASSGLGRSAVKRSVNRSRRFEKEELSS